MAESVYVFCSKAIVVAWHQPFDEVVWILHLWLFMKIGLFGLASDINYFPPQRTQQATLISSAPTMKGFFLHPACVGPACEGDQEHPEGPLTFVALKPDRHLAQAIA